MKVSEFPLPRESGNRKFQRLLRDARNQRIALSSSHGSATGPSLASRSRECLKPISESRIKRLDNASEATHDRNAIVNCRGFMRKTVPRNGGFDVSMRNEATSSSELVIHTIASTTGAHVCDLVSHHRARDKKLYHR
jgi:hypothetical protein